jgi:hypothetical protein
MLPAARARQLSATINVQMMDGQEVFGQHGDGTPWQPQQARH